MTLLAPRRRTNRRARRDTPLIGLLPIVVLLGAWQVFGVDQSPVWPRPSTWFEALAGLADRDQLWTAVGRTVGIFTAALLICTVIGLLLGLALGASAIARRATGPAFDFIRSVPPPALIPLAVLIIPDPTIMTLAVVVFSAEWPVLIHVAAGFAAIPPIRIEAARTLQIGRLSLFVKFVVPSLIPDLFLGIRIAAPIALVVTLAAEFLGTSAGIGRQLILAQSSFDAAQVFGLILVIALLGVVVNQVLAFAEAALLRNRHPAASR